MANRVITPVGRLSYPKLFVPETGKNGQKDKYSVTMVFAPGTDLSWLERAAMEVLVEKFGKETAAKMIKQGKVRFRGGSHHAFRTDAEARGYEEGTVTISARSTSKPGIVDAAKNPVTDPEQVYPGRMARISVSPYWYDAEGNKGLAWALNNVQVLQHADRLDNRVKAEDEFDVDEEAIAEMDTLPEPDADASADESVEEDDIAALLK